ncbi:4Fe-4S binding protein [Neobacillus drentensis]|uniref:DUF362 domain-containing protein n=1 Tax=Neobacillus drentensis TaxID=220684 RepID=UPI003000E181
MSLLVNWLESMHVDAKITNVCSRKRHLRSTCSLCSDACQFGAISIDSTSFEIEPEKCNSCGDCMIACPLSAIEGVCESREFNKNSLVYSESYIPTVKELLIYKQRGLMTIKTVPASLNQNWRTVVNKSNKILLQLEECTINIMENGRDNRMSRRTFFSSLPREGRQFAKIMAPASWKWLANEWIITSYFPDYQFYQVELDLEKCTLCEICFNFCSQKVFTVLNGHLQVSNEKCVNCYDCIDLCQQDAIQISPHISKKQTKQYPFTTKECVSCGRSFSTFHPKIDCCPVCCDRDPDWLCP